MKFLTYFLFFVLLTSFESVSYSQTSEILKARMMSQSQQTTQEPGVDVPGTGNETGVIRTSDILPEEVNIALPIQTPFIMDKSIDPNQYVLGPGDLVGVYLWGQIDKSYQIYISPEGYIIIPTVGALKVGEKTITQAVELFKDAVGKKYKGLDTTFFLIQPKRFKITVSGVVFYPGMMVSSAVEHVSDIIERVGLIIPENTIQKEANEKEINDNVKSEINESNRLGAAQGKQASSETTNMIPGRFFYVSSIGRTGRTMREGTLYGPEEYFTLGNKKGSSIRSIILHRNGEIIPVDLLRYIKFGDVSVNPYLNAGDQIEVKPYSGDIAVYGEVNDQGVYEFKKGDRVFDLLCFGGGLTSIADSTNAEIVRFSPDGKTLTRISLDLNDAINNPDDPKYVLQESDRLYVRKKFDYKESLNVVVMGEVKYPGDYAIQKNITTLSDVIKLAGGFTGYENLSDARIIRKSDFASMDVEYERLKNLGPLERNRFK